MPDDEVYDAVQVELDHGAHAPGQARCTVRQVLLAWRLPALVDTVGLAASELVANAVRHGRPPISVALRRRRRDVRLEVHDGDPAPPRLDLSADTPDGPVIAESGRGLQIVTTLASQVGCEPVPGGGKLILASFPAPDRFDLHPQ